MTDFEVHFALLVGVLSLTALLVALFTQVSYKHGAPSVYYMAMLTMLIGAAATGILGYKASILAQVVDSEARALGGLATVLTVAGCLWILEVFYSINPPLKLLKSWM